MGEGYLNQKYIVNQILLKIIRGSSNQMAANRKSRNGAMIPPRSHRLEHRETPKFLQKTKNPDIREVLPNRITSSLRSGM